MVTRKKPAMPTAAAIRATAKAKPRKARSAAQKAATKRMIAANRRNNPVRTGSKTGPAAKKTVRRKATIKKPAARKYVVQAWLPDTGAARPQPDSPRAWKKIAEFVDVSQAKKYVQWYAGASGTTVRLLG